MFTAFILAFTAADVCFAGSYPYLQTLVYISSAWTFFVMDGGYHEVGGFLWDFGFREWTFDTVWEDWSSVLLGTGSSKNIFNDFIRRIFLLACLFLTLLHASSFCTEFGREPGRFRINQRFMGSRNTVHEMTLHVVIVHIPDIVSLTVHCSFRLRATTTMK